MSDLVVKSNRLNTAIQNLSLAEVQIMQLAVVDARETGQGLSADKPLIISASRYAEAFGVTRQSAWEALLNAEKSLFERRFTFLNDRNNEVKSRWIQRVEYIKGEASLSIALTLDVVNEITRLDGYEQFFTQYLLSQTAQMNSVYSVRMYELLVQWKSAKKTPLLELDLFREQLGIENNEYQRMYDFKKRVLDLAVAEINEKSDLSVSYQQQKQGRKIIGFKFNVLEKPKAKQASKNSPVKQLTDKQINHFAAKLAQDAAFGSKYAKAGENAAAFEQRVRQELVSPVTQGKWAGDLRRVGFG